MTAKETVFPERVFKRLPDGFADEVASMKEEDLKRVVFETEGNLYTNEKNKEADEELNSLKEKVKEAGAQYKEAKTMQTAKLKYLMWMLEGRGVDLDNQDSKDA